MNKKITIINNHKSYIRLLYKKLSRLLKTASLLDTATQRIISAQVYSSPATVKTTTFVKKHSYISLVIIPVLIVAAYYVTIASPRYESTATVSLRDNNSTMPVDSSLSGLLGVSSPGQSNSYLLIDYIQSPEMLQYLQKTIGIKQMYQSHDIDIVSRLSSSADNLKFLKYYNSMISVEYNELSNSLLINAEGYTPEQSHLILNSIINHSQTVIDQISHKLAINRMNFSDKQLNDVKHKALKAQKNLVSFQNSRGMVDPESTLISKASVISALKEQLVTEETKLNKLRLYLNPKAEEIESTEQSIAAIKAQLHSEKIDFLTTDGKLGNKSELNDLVSNYQWLKLNTTFTMSEYTAALQSYEVARVDSLSQQSYLVDVVSATLPDTARYPRVLYNLLTLFMLLSAVYGLGRMILTIIIENR